MGILKWFYKKMVRSNTRGMCRVLLLNFNIAHAEEKKGRFVSKYYSDYIIFAMQGRSGWSKISDNTFKHDKTGIEIVVSTEDSLIEVAKRVAWAEIYLLDLPREEKYEFLRESEKAVEDYFNKGKGKLE